MPPYRLHRSLRTPIPHYSPEIVHGTLPSPSLIQNSVHPPVSSKLFVEMQLTDWGTLSDRFLDVQVHPHRFRDLNSFGKGDFPFFGTL